MDEKELKSKAAQDRSADVDIDKLLEQWMKEDANAQPQEPEAPETENPFGEPRTRRRSKEKKQGWQGTLLLYLHDLVYLLAGLLLVFLLLFRVVVVSGTSMNNTLYDGDYLLLLSNTFYHEPKRGDVIVASKQSFDDGAPIVKRVIATEGQYVMIDFENSKVYVGYSVNAMVELQEDYIKEPIVYQSDMESMVPVKVPEDCLFVMGDNRNNSTDSRSDQIGFIEKREVLGKVIFLFIPGNNEGKEEKDFGRIGEVN